MTEITIWQLAALGLTGAVGVLVLRKHTPELALVLTMVIVVLLLLGCIEPMKQLLELIRRLAELTSLSEELLTPLIKTIGISMVTRLSAQLCRDGGLVSGAVFLELAGVIFALVISIPLAERVLTQLEGML